VIRTLPHDPARESEAGRAWLAAIDAVGNAQRNAGRITPWRIEREDPQAIWSLAADVNHEIGRAAVWTLVWLLTEDA
jgi:hypothetical protein